MLVDLFTPLQLNILQVLGSEASLSKGADRSLYSPSSACKGLYESALAMVNEKSRERFFSEGSQLNFVEESLDTPMAWVEKDIYCRREDKTNNSADRIVSVCLPCTSSPASEHPSSSAGRFSGAFYFKCPSLAWMVEWVLGGFAKFS